MSQRQAYQKGRVVPAPCSLSLQATGRCRDNAALGQVGKAPQILELLPAPGLAVWGSRRRYKCLGEGRSRGGNVIYEQASEEER